MNPAVSIVCRCTFISQGQVIRATFSFNLSRNIVALQVERLVARITTGAQLATQQISVLHH